MRTQGIPRKKKDILLTFSFSSNTKSSWGSQSRKSKWDGFPNIEATCIAGCHLHTPFSSKKNSGTKHFGALRPPRVWASPSPTQNLSQNSLHKSPQQANLTSLRKFTKLLIIPALFLLTVNFPLDSHRALFPHHNHLRLLTAIATCSVYSMKHLAGSMASIHHLPHGSHFLESCPSLISGGKNALATFPTGR